MECAIGRANPQGPFLFSAPLLLHKSTDEGGQRVIEGIMSTEDEDLERERLMESGALYHYMLRRAAINKAALDRLDFDQFQNRHGWIKWEHPGDAAHSCRSCGERSCFREPETIIGWPVQVKKSYAYHDPVSGLPKVGTYLKAELFPAEAGNPFADAAHRLLSSIKKSNCPRRIGWSIEGAYLDRDEQTGLVKKCLVTGVVLTTKPVNTLTWAQVTKSLIGCSFTPECGCNLCREVFSKAVTAGYGTDSAELEGGAALRKQSHQGLEERRASKMRCYKLGCNDPNHDHSHLLRRSLEYLCYRKGFGITEAREFVERFYHGQ